MHRETCRDRGAAGSQGRLGRIPPVAEMISVPSIVRSAAKAFMADTPRIFDRVKGPVTRDY